MRETEYKNQKLKRFEITFKDKRRYHRQKPNLRYLYTVNSEQQGQEHRLHPVSADVTSKSVSGMIRGGAGHCLGIALLVRFHYQIVE